MENDINIGVLNEAPTYIPKPPIFKCKYLGFLLVYDLNKPTTALDAMNTSELKQYFIDNAPPPDVLARFSQSISDWHIAYPLYDEETDTLSGMVGLMFTIAIAHDISPEPMGGFNERYCFEDHDRGLRELVSWHQRGFDDQRPSGWVATRNVSARTILDSFTKHHGDNYGHNLLTYTERNIHSEILSNKELIKKDLGLAENDINHISAYLKAIGKIV